MYVYTHIYIYIYIYIYRECPITRILLIKSIWYFHKENPNLKGPSLESNCRQLIQNNTNCTHLRKDKRAS